MNTKKGSPPCRPSTAAGAQPSGVNTPQVFEGWPMLTEEDGKFVLRTRHAEGAIRNPRRRRRGARTLA